MKKIISLLLALSLLFAVSVPAFAVSDRPVLTYDWDMATNMVTFSWTACECTDGEYPGVLSSYELYVVTIPNGESSWVCSSTTQSVTIDITPWSNQPCKFFVLAVFGTYSGGCAHSSGAVDFNPSISPPYTSYSVSGNQVTLNWSEYTYNYEEPDDVTYSVVYSNQNGVGATIPVGKTYSYTFTLADGSYSIYVSSSCSKGGASGNTIYLTIPSNP